MDNLEEIIAPVLETIRWEKEIYNNYKGGEKRDYNPCIQTPSCDTIKPQKIHKTEK